MSYFRPTIACLVVSLVAGIQAAPAQQLSQLAVPSPTTGNQYNNEFAGNAEGATGNVVPAAKDASATDGDTDSACADAAGDDAAPEMLRLFECCLTKRWGLNIGGWTAQSFTWNPQNPADRFNGPVTWLDQANQYQLNEQWLYFDRPTATGGDGWDAGGRVDINYGTNARFDTEAGLENRVNTPNNPYMALALQQFYGELAYNKLKVKFGHFLSPVGYFVVPTPQNFFNTLPYTFQYGEPFTHTGMLATWTASEHWAIGGGLIRGWDNFSSANPNLGSLTTVTWTGDNKDSLAWVWVQSHEPNSVSGGAGPPPGGRVYTSRFLQTLVYTRPLTDKLTWIAQSDLGVQGAAVVEAVGPAKTARWYGLNQYWFYKVNDSWTWGLSYEWFRDEEGFRVGNLMPSVFNPSNSSWGNSGANPPVGPGFAGNFNDINFGPQWRPRGSQNLLIRPDLRWDWYGGSRNPQGQLPYDAGTRSQQFIWGTDVVILY